LARTLGDANREEEEEEEEVRWWRGKGKGKSKEMTAVGSLVRECE
jgi:hypothetical protein